VQNQFKKAKKDIPLLVGGAGVVEGMVVVEVVEVAEEAGVVETPRR
jgi:hypothetical protein